MGVSSAMLTGVSGLLSQAEALNVIGNNISNVNTAGFKYGRTLFSDLISERISSNSDVGKGAQIQSVENIFSQGSIAQSENPTDMAISGKGFFVVQDNSSTPTTYYTRAGAFHPDENAKYLINSDGMRLCDSAGAPIDLSTLANLDKITNIGLDGKISYLDKSGNSQVSTTVVGIATFANDMGLNKAGGNMYLENPASGGSGKAKVDKPTQNSKIYGRSLEQSNVDIAAQMVNLIVTQRAYSANSKIITTGDEMSDIAINLKR